MTHTVPRKCRCAQCPVSAVVPLSWQWQRSHCPDAPWVPSRHRLHHPQPKRRLSPQRARTPPPRSPSSKPFQPRAGHRKPGTTGIYSAPHGRTPTGTAAITRNDLLRRDLSAVEVKPGTSECVVLSGQLADPYTGDTVQFVRGSGPGVDIDHLVPLMDAWQKGAQGWDQAKREQLANDPANLAATSASANRSKGDSDLATWLPPARSYWCTYTAEIVAVKASYGLWMTPAEHSKASEILKECTK